MDTIKKKNKGIEIKIDIDHTQILDNYIPRGCPFKDYTLYNLLLDLIDMYGWKVTSEMTLIDFVKLLQDENYTYANAYGDAIIEILES